MKESAIIDTYGEFKNIKIEEQVVQDLGNVKEVQKIKEYLYMVLKCQCLDCILGTIV